MMLHVSIRAMRREDTAIWRDMRASLYGEDPSLLPELEDYFAGDSQISAAFLAECGKPAGFIELGLRSYAEGCDTSPVPYIEGIYVEAEHRRSGIGRALVAAAERWAKQHGHTEMASDARVENDTSLAAHRAYGFAVVERIICFRKSLI
jgi:aminoglycoside 6'-N-acetyltransferase I